MPRVWTQEQKDALKARLAAGRKKKAAMQATSVAFAAEPAAVRPHLPKGPLPGYAAPPVAIQMGPTKGYMFAVFAQNPEFHELPVEIWDAAAKLALQRKVAIMGATLIDDIKKEPLRPFNWMVEYRA